jgi:hypothetical protein
MQQSESCCALVLSIKKTTLLHNFGKSYFVSFVEGSPSGAGDILKVRLLCAIYGHIYRRQLSPHCPNDYLSKRVFSPHIILPSGFVPFFATLCHMKARLPHSSQPSPIFIAYRPV